MLSPARLLFLVPLAGLLTFTQAQETMRFRRIGTADGLTDNAITCLHQDRGGYLWIGTEAGLNRYDGNHVTTWRRSDGLGGEQVNDVLVDAGGTCWVAMRDGGLSRIAPDGSIRSFRHMDQDSASIAVDRLICLFDLDDTTLMIGAEQVPIIFMDKRTNAFSYWSGSGPITPAKAVQHIPRGPDWCHYITAVDDHRLAIGFLLGMGQYLVDRRSGTIQDTTFARHNGEQTISDVVRMGDRFCGVGWQPWISLRRLSAPKEGMERLPLPDEVTCIVPADSEHVLVGLRMKGLVEVDLRDGSLRSMTHRITDRRTIADDRIRCLLHDDGGRIWVGTRNGLSVFDPLGGGLEAIPIYGDDGAGRADVNAMRIDLDDTGRPVVSTSDGLFTLLDDGTFLHQVPTFEGGPQETTGFFRTPLGTYLGTEFGLYRYDPLHARSSALAPTSLQTGLDLQIYQVRNLYADTLEGRPGLVIGVMGYGTSWFDPTDMRLHVMVMDHTKPRSIANNLTRQLLRTRDGTYWTATPGGLFRWLLDRRHVENAYEAYRMDTPQHPLPGNDVRALAEGGDGSLWVATRDGGLARIRNDTVTAFQCPRAQGNSLFGLTLDRRGRVWCTTASGIEVFDPAERSFHHLPVEGMQGSATLGCCIAQLPDGRIAFVAENTFFIADPERTFATRALPAPYFTGLRVDGRQALQRVTDGVLRMDAGEHGLIVGVSALELTGGPLSFAVRLDGVDEVPHIMRGSEEVSYASLPPGTYRLFARTLDSSGTPGVEKLLAVVRVAAPFWQRWWFFAIVAVLVSAGVYGWSRYRLRQALALQAVRDRIASDLHDEVGSSLSSITIGSQLAAQLSREENEQVRQLMARIGRTSSESLQSMSDIVWAIDPKNDEGEALVKRMHRIADDLLERKGIQVDFAVTGGVEDLKLPMDVRKDLLLIYKEAVHNVSKHSSAQRASITLARMNGMLSLRVSDDGRGFDPALHPDGHGLGSMQRRAQALRAGLEVRSAPGAGTVITAQVDLSRIRV